MNIPLLQKTRDAILAEPIKFNMCNWFLWESESPCKTSACIAGHGYAIVKQIMSLREARDNAEGKIQPIQYRMQFEFGLTDDQTETLFFDEEWPNPFRDDYSDAVRLQDRIKMAQVAADRIDHLIETGK
jgi:hypothetical protein